MKKINVSIKLVSIILLAGLSLAFAQTASAQKAGKRITITGTVTDQDKKPVEGAVIFIDKVKTGSVTDRNGSYSVKARQDASEILVFTLLYGSQEELINGRTAINFTLGKVSSGTPAREKNPAASTKVLDGRDPEFSSYQNIYDMIKGRFPGVEVSGKSIKVMGSSSLNVSTEPLFVVDGIVVNSIEDIVPQTVNTIEVLKGPDASVWGTRGANGVIVITRRKE